MRSKDREELRTSGMSVLRKSEPTPQHLLLLSTHNTFFQRLAQFLASATLE